MKHIVILGGGFGGVSTAIRLKKEFGKKVKITLISNRDYLFMYPFSIWVPVKKRTLEELSVPIVAIAKKYGIVFLKESILEIKINDHKVVTDRETYVFDQLIIALGTEHTPIEGMEFAMTLCGRPNDTLRIQQRLDMMLEKGKGVITFGYSYNESDPSTLRVGPLLEVLFNIDHYLRVLGVREKYKLVFYQPDASSIEQYGGKAFAELINHILEEKNIEASVKSEVNEFIEDGIIFKNGETILAELNIFMPRLKGPVILTKSDLPLSDSGFVKIDGTCAVEGPGSRYCFALGDCVTYDGPDFKLKQGKTAEDMSKVLVTNIKLQERGQKEYINFVDSLETIFLLDMGNEGVFLQRNNSKTVVKRGVFYHWAKILLEKIIRFNIS